MPVVDFQTIHRDRERVGLVCRRRPKGPTRYKGDPLRRLQHCRSVLQFAKANWKKMIFVDEKFFDSQDGDVFAYCKPGVAPPARERERFPSRCHVFGLIGLGVKKLVIFPSTCRIDSHMYLQKCLIPHKSLLQKSWFLHDGAGCHKGVADWLVANKVKVVDHPARSPDLNPIERLWGTLQRQVSARGPLTEDGIAKFVQQKWDELPQKEVDKYVASWPQMIQSVISMKGETSVKNVAV